ncbi:hypothetical protein B0E44_11405 [Flavobacterium sp. A45]|nr:hypothetical protein B0E44_11405 [Flavobacterium sp. A45]
MSIDISNNTALKSLDCNYNLLTNFDVTKNSNLSSIKCSNNNLTNIDISNNTKLYKLECENNQLTTLDLSTNTSLQYLRCYNNKLNSLDITKNKFLIDLYCGNNPISTLDFTNNLSLARLSCNSNNLTTLDVSKHLNLQTLECQSNSLKKIDVTSNTKLEYLRCSNNQLTTLDVTKNVLLYTLQINDNQITTIDISNNKKLGDIVCFNNFLTSLDISNNKTVFYVNCNNNKLTYLNLKNGNSNPLYISYDLANYKNNPNLRCIQVNDAVYAKERWSNLKDATARFSEDCGAPLVFLSNNFNVESKGETCSNSNNGEINITAQETFSYVASINGKSYLFTNNSLKVVNLAPGTYTVSITIPGENFEQSYTIVIPKGATITGKSSVTANKVSVEITEGTAPYTVFVDGIEQFETTDSNFTVDAKKGGLLQVKTAKACEGIYAKDIARLDGVISAYPNPTSGSFEIELPSTKKEVIIALYTLDGQMISVKTYIVENGKAQLSLENQPTGVYVVKIELDIPDYLKILKN